VRRVHVAIGLAVLILAPIAIVHVVLRSSLPTLDGTIHAAELSGPATIARDSLGIPTITATNRTDLAYATGFAHGQDRFFQMDLSRRLAAGELSELVGSVALEQDEAARRFRFRGVAREVVRQAPPELRALLEAYARGVNDGVTSLGVRPFEYWLLRSTPSPWLPEDSILVVHSMWWQLQYLGFNREILRQQVNARLHGPDCEGGWKCGLSFFYPARTQWDAPATGPGPAAGTGSATDTIPEPAGANIPTPDVIDVRGSGPPTAHAHVAIESPVVGSNNSAAAGSLTASGAAIVANDMHLSQRVPVVWYRARLRTTNAAGVDLMGLTLPGAPLLVVGSNGHIAWGFTNSYGKWLDVTFAPCTSVGPNALQTASGSVPLTVQTEEIRVHGAVTVAFPVRSGPGGVLLSAHPERGQCWFGAWLAQVPEATNLNLIELERVTTVREALEVAPRIGIPHQNAIIGDREGHIGWTIFGRIPLDEGPNRSAGHPQWDDGAAHPHTLDPPSGRLWSANARVTSDPQEERAIGGDIATLGAQYDLGARAGQVRDDLQALQGGIQPAALLKIQLDDRAIFLTRWQQLLSRTLDAQAVRNNPRRAELKRLVDSWDARADTASVGYRIVRTWRDHTERTVWEMILDALHIEADESFTVPTQFEEPLWQLVTRQPLHMLAPRYPGWRDLLLQEVDATIAELLDHCAGIDQCTWGLHNTIRIRHPLSPAVPWLSGLLDMPTEEIPGDRDMPRVQGQTYGASERFAVSPGHEAQGYLHMPGGQSGHPLSPYYRDGFDEWVRGEPLPFLPGAAQHTVTLMP
jgi:penicillin amidase